MSNDKDSFTVELITEDERATLAEELKGLDGVERTVSMGVRGADAGTILQWVEVGNGVLTMASLAVPLIQQLVDRIRARGIRGARIQLSEEVVIEADTASPEEVEQQVQKAS